ncbi:MAG TPA: DUF2795 domain-containing protein [Actinomycetota bacterium]|nr:DUF2795 domain-containing protein [Actinomycetota bacterium]
MERGSAKHGPRLDEQLHKETLPLEQGAPASPRIDEHRAIEDASEDEPSVAQRIDLQSDQPLGHGLSFDEIEQRSRIARFVQPSRFPSDRDALVASAHELHAPTDVIAALQALPGDKTYENVQAIWDALGGHVEHHR